MYLDAVVDVMLDSIFNGTQEEVLSWLEQHMIFAPVVQVCVGRTLEILSVDEYIKRYSRV